MSAFLAVFGWYAAGFLIADRLVTHGHSSRLWWITAALLGGAVAIPAAIAVLWRLGTPAQVDVVRTGRRAGGIHVAAVAPPDELSATVAAVPAALTSRALRVSAVGIVGHEAFSSVVDTGERPIAVETLRSVRQFAPDEDRLLTSGGVEQLDAALRHVGVPDLVIATVGDTNRAIRHNLRQAIEISSRCAVPIMVLPGSRTRETTRTNAEAVAA